MAKKYYMSKSQMHCAFEEFKNDERIKEALEEGYFIYIRENGFLIIKPNSMCPTQVTIKGKVKIVKPLLSKTKLEKIEKNYCLFTECVRI